jgi:ribosomal protein S18 acetylase RimI-like enzyme
MSDVHAEFDAYEKFEYAPSPARDERFRIWRQQLRSMSSSAALLRRAAEKGQDGRRIKDLQVACSPISVRSVRDNVSMIARQEVLLAEVDGIHVGFCVSHLGASESDPLFIQLVGVASEAQQRGIGLALITAASAHEPRRDVAVATQDSNTAARALNERFARSIGASIERVKLGTYRDPDLGIVRGLGYRAWLIRRPATNRPRSS